MLVRENLETERNVKNKTKLLSCQKVNFDSLPNTQSFCSRVFILWKSSHTKPSQLTATPPSQHVLQPSLLPPRPIPQEIRRLCLHTTCQGSPLFTTASGTTGPRHHHLLSGVTVASQRVPCSCPCPPQLPATPSQSSPKMAPHLIWQKLSPPWDAQAPHTLPCPRPRSPLPALTQVRPLQPCRPHSCSSAEQSPGFMALTLSRPLPVRHHSRPAPCLKGKAFRARPSLATLFKMQCPRRTPTLHSSSPG